MLPWTTMAVVLTLSFLFTSCEPATILPESAEPEPETISATADFPTTASEETQTLSPRNVWNFSGEFYSGRTTIENRFPDRARVVLNLRGLSQRIVNRNGEYVVAVSLHTDLNANGLINVRMPNAPAGLTLDVVYLNTYPNAFLLKFSFDPQWLVNEFDGQVILNLDNQGTPLPQSRYIIQDIMEDSMCCAGDITVVLDDMAPSEMQ